MAIMDSNPENNQYQYIQDTSLASVSNNFQYVLDYFSFNFKRISYFNAKENTINCFRYTYDIVLLYLGTARDTGCVITVESNEFGNNSLMLLPLTIQL